MAMEIIEAEASPHGERLDDWTPGYDFEDGFRDKPVIGAGLGLENSSTSASLGGYIRIRARSATGAEKVLFTALSCHHSFSSMSDDGDALLIFVLLIRPSRPGCDPAFYRGGYPSVRRMPFPSRY